MEHRHVPKEHHHPAAMAKCGMNWMVHCMESGVRMATGGNTRTHWKKRRRCQKNSECANSLRQGFLRHYFGKKNQTAGRWWHTPLVQAFRRKKQVDLCEFEVSLVYRASSRAGSKATEKPCLKKPKKQKKQKKTTNNNNNKKVSLRQLSS